MIDLALFARYRCRIEPRIAQAASTGYRVTLVLLKTAARQAQNCGVSLEEYARWKVAAEKSGSDGESSGFHNNRMLSFKAVAR